MSKPSSPTLLPTPRPLSSRQRLELVAVVAALGVMAAVATAAWVVPAGAGLKRAIEAERFQAQAPRPCGQATIAQGGR